MLNIDKLKENYQMIHFFVLGFVQLKIDNNLRYHFYHPELNLIVDEEEVHNHRYDFISTILAGSLTNILFDYNIDKNGLYLLEKESCNQNKILNKTPLEVNLFKKSETTYYSNQSYTCLTNHYHKVKTDFAITRLYRGDIISDFANVIRRADKKSICPFSKPLSEKECWEIVESCILMNK